MSHPAMREPLPYSRPTVFLTISLISVLIVSAARAEMVGRWTFNGVTENGDVPDTSGHANSKDHSGKLRGNASVKPVIGANRAVDLDGVAAHVDFGAHSDFNLTGTFTLEVWVLLKRKPDGAEALIVGKSANVYGLSYYYRDGNTYSYVSGGGVETRVKHSLAFDQWHHVVTTFDPEVGLKLFVNGGQVGECASRLAPPSSQWHLLLGAPFAEVKSDAPSRNYLRGEVDEFRLYNHAMTVDEVAASSAAGPTKN